MKILECFIENFGKISAEKFEFTDGFNLILAENGYGKTTLSVFIKCMLYGMEDTKRQNLDENERKKYLPWSGAQCGGSLTFETKGKIYRAERRFAPKASDDSFALYDTALGRECNDFTENLGEEIFGIDADGFMRTLFLSERALSQKNDNRTISAKLSELVGCDGDISSMTEALKLLEDQRKFYMKKGGSGEISDIKAELSRTTDALAELDVCEERMKSTEKTLSALAEKEIILRKEEQQITKERETLAKLGSEESYRKALSEMRSRLAETEAKRDELIELFGGNIPTEAEIDRAKMTEAEIKRLSISYAEDDFGEFSSLKNFFESKATPEMITNAAQALERLRRGNYPKSEDSLRIDLLFANRTPSKSELNSLKERMNAKTPLPLLPLILGSALALIGAILGIAVSVPLFFLSLIGIGLCGCAPFIQSKKAKKKDSEIRAFFASLSSTLANDNRPTNEILSELYSLLDASELENAVVLNDRENLFAFASLFGKCNDPLADTAEILKKHERYKELLAVEKYKADKRSSAAEELTVKKAELEGFISQFNCKTDSPITEISLALNEYKSLSAEIISKHTAIASLTSNHKLSDITAKGVRPIEELNLAYTKVSEALRELNRERTLLDRQYNTDSERVDEREELLSKKQELEEKYDKYTDNLQTVILTKKYLETAKENMTSKYLGKTKTGFEKYSSLISGEDGSFDMDTSFAVSKTEGAKTHSTEAYSRGIRELYGIAVRFALIDSLYENETPFVILDDPFISLDDEKCKKALDILSEISKERQIIYFTCSASRT